MHELELRSVQFGQDQVQVAVRKREDGKAIPRAMIAGINAAQLVDLVGAASFYYGIQIDFARRVDTSNEVAEAVDSGMVELGVVSEVPVPLQEGVGILLNLPLEGNSNIAILGKISSKLEPTQ